MHRAPGLDTFTAEEQGEGQLHVAEANDGQGSTTLTLRRVLESECGSHILRVGCTLWVYNCAGLPLAIQQAPETDSAEQEASQAFKVLRNTLPLEILVS